MYCVLCFLRFKKKKRKTGWAFTLLVASVVSLKVVLISALCIIIAMEKLYSPWAVDSVFVDQLGHMLEDVQNAWFTHS